MKEVISYHREEKLNAISHGIGSLLGVVGFFMLWQLHDRTIPLATVSVIIYSISIIVLFSASTLYHSVHNPGFKKKLRILDHISIFILIAGTYTPVALLTLIDGMGLILFYTVWGIAFAGILFKLFYTGKYEFISLFLYLAMGWLIVFDFQSLWLQLSGTGIILLFVGGAFYTLGIFFYAIKKIPYNHLIWHLFVLGGAISHWFLIYSQII
jgi:hemolysin III